MKAIYESKRLAFLIVIFVVSVGLMYYMGGDVRPSAAHLRITTVAYKFALLTSVIIFAHIVRQLMHPYLDIKELMDRTPITRAASILGIFIFISAIILAFMLGI